MNRFFFQNILILISFLISFDSVSSEEEFRMSSSEKAWSVFNPNDNQKCFIVSQSIKDEAFRNGEKLSSVNRDRGKLFIQKDPSSPSGFVASFSAGYPLKIGGRFILKIDNKNKIVFLASPKPQNSEEKAWAWTQVHDDKNLIEYLKIGNRAVMEAVSHRGTITKDTFELSGFTKAIERLKTICK